jgi:hypothetical protein
MQAVYKLMANQLDQDFIQSIQTLFKGKAITITIDSMMDETEYLSADKANLQHLLDNDLSTQKRYFEGNSFQSFVNQNCKVTN